MEAVARSVFRLACRIAGQSAGMPLRTNEASCVVLRVLLIAVASACLVFTGCGGVHLSSSTTPVAAARGTIGATGGVVSIPQGAQVVIPQNALAIDTTIGVDQTATGAPPLPAGAKPLGPIVAFTPHGTTFAVPVTMTLPFDAASLPSGTKPALVKTNDSQTGWEIIGGSMVNGNTISAPVTGFSYATVLADPDPLNDPPHLVTESWQFEHYYTGSTNPFKTETVVLPARQSADMALQDEEPALQWDVDLIPFQGVINVFFFQFKPERVALHPPGVYGSYNSVSFNQLGTSFTTESVAPEGAVEQPHSKIGRAATMTLTRVLHKTDDSASLKAVITTADLEAIDANGDAPSGAECPWGGPTVSCDHTMVSELQFKLDAWYTLPNGSFVTLRHIDGTARLSGFRRFWTFTSGPSPDSDMPFFNSDDFDRYFDFDQDSSARHALVEPSVLPVDCDQPLFSDPRCTRNKVIDIPLAAVPRGGEFNVQITTATKAINRRQHESYLGAYVRDPAKSSGVQVIEQGVEVVRASGPQTVPVPPTPAPPRPASACTTATDPAAGVIQFESASIDGFEEAGATALVRVARSGGSKGAVSAVLSMNDGSAHTGVDYTPVTTVVRFQDGEQGARLITIPLIDNDTADGDRTASLALSQPMGCAALGTQSTATLIIHDDDTQTTTPTYQLGGTVSGLTGTGLVIKDLISGGTATANSNGTFTLSSPTPIFDGFAYNVIIATQPTNPDQSCTVANATGTVSGADATNISVSCVSSVPSGSLDPTFGDAGKVTSTIPYSPGIVDAKMGMALQPDGKILMVGGTTLARFNPDGTLDTSFGTGGQATVPFNQSGFDTAQDVAVQADGKIVVVGLTSNSLTFNDDFALARFNADGTLDSSFGSGGKVTTDFFGSVDQARRVRIMPDGKILVAGFAVQVISSTSSVRHFALARYNTDGSLDSGFGNGGKVDEAAGASFSQARGMAIQSDGKIVVAGSGATDGVSDPDVAITRFFGADGIRPPGTRDDTFGPTGQGFDLTNLGLSTGYEAGVDVVALADDTIFVAAEVTVGPAAPPPGRNSQFTLVSFDPNDNQRRPQPAIIPITTQSDRPMQMLLQSDGKAVIVGRSGDLSSNADMAIVRFNAGGLTPDPSFGTNGVLTVDFFGGRDSADAVVQQQDGKLVVGGFARVGSGIVFALVRVMP